MNDDSKQHHKIEISADAYAEYLVYGPLGFACAIDRLRIVDLSKWHGIQKLLTMWTMAERGDL